MIDMTEQISSVRRQVGTRTLEAGEARTVTISQAYDTAAEDDGRARFELEHTMHVDDHWDKFGPGAVGVGYDMMLIGLTLHIASSGATVDPAEAMAWLSGPEGARFVRDSNEAWYQAHVA